MRQETGPFIGDEDLRIGDQQPTVGRGNNIRVLVRGKYIIEMRRQEIARHLCQQVLVCEVTAGIEQHPFPIIDNKELIGLNPLALHQIGEGNAFMRSVVIQQLWHYGLLCR